MSASGYGSDQTTPAPPGPPKPDYLAAGFKVVLGLAFGAASGWLCYEHVHHLWKDPSVGGGVVTGMALGFGVWGLLSGGFQFAGRKWGVPRGLAVFLACAVIGGVVEPRLHRSQRLQAEREGWERLQASPKRFEDYEKYAYYRDWKDVPKRSFAGPMALVQVKEELERQKSKKGGGVEALRRMLSDFNYRSKDEEPGAFQPAIDLAREALARAYAKALEELAVKTRAEGTAAEFPEDPGMRAAFRTILEHVARSDDDRVYLAFSGEYQLESAAPKPADLIEAGDAFSPERESKRRGSFRSAMDGALRKAFTEPLVRIQTLDPGESREKKIVFEVRCTTKRTPGEFTLTQDNKPVGKLFKLEVAWEFSIFDAGGKPLTRHTSRSNPAQSIQFSYKRGDPTWSAYSVMLDSAYYNFCRQITGRLGMIPPPVREHFSFER